MHLNYSYITYQAVESHLYRLATLKVLDATIVIFLFFSSDASTCTAMQVQQSSANLTHEMGRESFIENP